MRAFLQITARRGLLALIGLLLVAGCETTPRAQRGTDTQGERTAIARAEQYKAGGQFEAALAAFQQALDANPRSVSARIGIGDIREAQGDYRAAANRYAQAKQLDPTNFKATYKLGLMYHLLNRVRDAAREYLASLVLRPNDYAANINLATAYLQLGEPELGLPYAEKAVRLRPDRQIARANLGSIYSALGRYDSAIDEFRAAAELGDLKPEIAMNLADALLRAGKTERAINTLKTLASTSGQNNPAVYERLGYTYFKAGRYDESLVYYDRALAIDPNNPASLNGKGVNLMTMYLKGSRMDLSLRDRAIAAWQRSVKLKPDQRKIIDLIARYRKL